MGIKEVYKKLYSKGRWLEFDGYKIDRRIFKIVSGLILLSFLFIAYENDFDFTNKLYIKCDNPLGCQNPLYSENNTFISENNKPFYDKCIYDWCNSPYLEYGFEFGQKPINFSFIGWTIGLGFISLGFLINHFLNNKSYKAKINWEGLDNEEL